MKRNHPSIRYAPRPIGAPRPNRAGAAVRAVWVAGLLLIVASIYHPAQAEPFAPTGGIQLAGRHEDGKAWPQKPAQRAPVPAASTRMDDRAAPPAGNRGERAGSCHPELTKCWRK